MHQIEETTVFDNITTLEIQDDDNATLGPQIGNWRWINTTTNNTCIIIRMAAQLNVTYLDTSL